MPQYMLSVHVVEGQQRPPMTEAERELQMKRIGELEADMRASGTWRFSARLHGPDTATVVRRVEGRRVTSDGPFVESKEHLAGYYIVEVADLDRAIALAAKVPAARYGGIEVRPVMGMSNAEM